MDEPYLRIVRLRLPGLTEPLYVLRLHGPYADDERFPGGERLLSRGGRVVAARSPSRLLAANEGPEALDAPLMWGMLVLDVRAVGRRLARPPERWSGTTRGTIVAFDDLVWDAASTCDDDGWAEQVRDERGFHALYAYVWGDSQSVPPARERQALWAGMSRGALNHMIVIDRHLHAHGRRS